MSARGGVSVLLFDGVELLDFAGPIEVFSVAARYVEPSFGVQTVSQHTEVVTTHNGLRVLPDLPYEDCLSPQVLVIPGGRGTRQQLENRHLLAWLPAAVQSAELVISVCTGSLLLAAVGVLDGLRVTTHHASLEALRQLAPAATLCAGERFIDNGKIIVGAGIAAGLDASLYGVRKWLGRQAAEQTATHMEYPVPWRTSDP